MSSSVIKVDKKEFKKIADYYKPYRIHKNVPYTEFSAKKDGVTITAYTSGKILFQGNNAEQEAAVWQSTEKNTAKNGKTATALPADFASKAVIGSDEVGNGSYFGPLTVCAAYADHTTIPKLAAIGVKDSKMLTDPQIRNLSKQIKTLIPYKLLIVPPEKYNEIQPKYNAVHMKVALHNQAIRLLLEKIAPTKPEAILIDQFTSPANYQKYLTQEKQPVTQNLYFATKGEQHHIAVAAASIISRASFLEELDRASAELGFTVPSGAGSKSDQVAAKILRKGGIELLAKYAKLHFANTEKAAAINQRS